MIKDVKFDGTQLLIKFTSEVKSEFYDMLTIIKANIIGRLWDSKRQVWTAPPLQKNVEYLKMLDFRFSSEVQALMGPRHVPSTAPVDREKLAGLFPYQVQGVQFLEDRGGVGIIADEMGLGKTIQALGHLIVHPEHRPALVVCPASVKGVWVQESMRWLGLRSSDVTVIYSRTPSALGPRSLYVINYDIIKDWEEVLKGLSLKLVIGDEVQYVSSSKAQRTKAFVRIVRSVPHKIFLSGTPIKNYPSEFFTVLNLLDPVTFPNQWQYQNRYCDPKYNGFGWTFKGATNQDELRELVEPVMIRREKKEVLKELPDKLKEVVPLECGQVELDAYEDASEKFREWVSENIRRKGLDVQNQVERLKQLAYLAKRNSVIQWIRDFLKSGQKLVVFGVHLNVLDDIEREFRGDCVRIDGGTPSQDRQKLVDQFQNEAGIKLFIGQIVAAGVGITLTAASAVALLELPWTNADIDQASDRCHRIGQKQCVNVYYLIADGTIENKIISLLDRKREVLTKIIDGKDAREEDLLGTLLKEFEGRRK